MTNKITKSINKHAYSIEYNNNFCMQITPCGFKKQHFLKRSLFYVPTHKNLGKID